MRWLLFFSLLLVGCPDALPLGKKGDPCYQNGSCDWSLTCIQWKDGAGHQQSVCATPQDVVIGYAELVKCEAKAPECPKCPEPPFYHINQMKCPPLPPPLHCPPPVRCPKVPEGPCPEVKACEPGWRRPDEFNPQPPRR